MPTRSTADTWGSVTRSLHWISALVIIGLLSHGWWMTHLADRPVRQWNYATHAMIALYFVLLLALRVVWRLAEPTPHQAVETPAWQSWVARGTHLAMYLLLIGMVTTGYLMWSSLPSRFDPARAALWDFSMFGLFKVPSVYAGANRDISKYWEAWHEFLSHFLQVLVVVHIGAALWHQFFKRDAVLRRMSHGRA